MYEVIEEKLHCMKPYEKYELLNEIDFLLENIKGKSNILCPKKKIKRFLSIISVERAEASDQILINYIDIASYTYKIQRIIVDEIRDIKEELMYQGKDIVEMQDNIDLIMEIIYVVLPDIAEISKKDYSPLIEKLNNQIKKTVKSIMAQQAQTVTSIKSEVYEKIAYSPKLLLLSPAASYALIDGCWKGIHLDSNLKDYYFSNIDQIHDICKRITPDIIVMPDAGGLSSDLNDICNHTQGAEIINIADFYAYLWFMNMADQLRVNSEIAVIDHYDTAISNGAIKNIISLGYMELKSYVYLSDGTIQRCDYGYKFEYDIPKFMINMDLKEIMGNVPRIIRTFSTGNIKIEKKLNAMEIFPLERSCLQYLSTPDFTDKIVKMLDTLHNIREDNE